MGTACALRLLSSDPQAVARASEAAVAEVARLELKYSRYRGDSLLSAINHAAAAGGEISLDDETVGLLDYAFACHQQSGGLFDITSGVLRRAWDFKLARRPEAGEIERLLPLVGLQKLDWRAPVLRFPQAGMEIDFGGDREGIRGGQGRGGLPGPRPVARPRRPGRRHQRDWASSPTGPPGPWAHGIRIGRIRPWRCWLSGAGGLPAAATMNGSSRSTAFATATSWTRAPVGRCAVLPPLAWAAESCLVAGSLCTIAMLKQDEGPAWLQSLSIRSVWMDSAGRQGECASAP